MGGWCRIAGNSADAAANILGCFAATERVAEIADVGRWIAGALGETPLVFASTPPVGDAARYGLTDNHWYAVVGAAASGIALIDPRPDARRTGRVFTVSAGVFAAAFQSVAYAVLPGSGWVDAEIWFEIAGENDGRFFAGDGPYMGNIPQWKVRFTEPCTFRIVCVMVSKSENVIGFRMCRNEGNKVSYKELEDVEFKGAIEGSFYAMKGKIDMPRTYTLAISWKKGKNPAYVYCRIEAERPFEVAPIREPPLDELEHVTACGKCIPGRNDGVGKFAPQWHLRIGGPARVIIRVSTAGARTQHSFFVGVPNTPGRFSRPGRF
jgi:hypothetical protein